MASAYPVNLVRMKVHKPPVVPAGVNNMTPASQHAHRLAFGTSGLRSTSGKRRKKKATAASAAPKRKARRSRAKSASASTRRSASGSKRKSAHLVKGSAAAKRRMSQLRKMRKTG